MRFTCILSLRCFIVLFCVYNDLLRCLVYMILICVYFTMYWVTGDLMNKFNHYYCRHYYWNAHHHCTLMEKYSKHYMKRPKIWSRSACKNCEMRTILIDINKSFEAFENQLLHWHKCVAWHHMITKFITLLAKHGLGGLYQNNISL